MTLREEADSANGFGFHAHDVHVGHIYFGEVEADCVSELFDDVGAAGAVGVDMERGAKG